MLPPLAAEVREGKGACVIILNVQEARSESWSLRAFPILQVLRDYSAVKARPDLIAGLTVALFTIPQAMAYSLIAGLPPSAGLATAIVASIFGALFGSSEFLINGPTNAISVMIASNVAIFASQGDPQQGVVLLTLIIGIGQLIGAAIRAGALTRFISEPVLVGFTAGAGVYVAVNQLPSVLGLEKSQVVKTIGGWTPPGNPLFDFCRAAMSLGNTHLSSALVAGATLLIVRLLQHYAPRLRHKIPAPFVTIVLVSAVTWALGMGVSGPWKIKLVQDIEPLTRTMPHLRVPQADWGQVSRMLMPAFAIGLLGAVEAIAISKALASRAGHRFSANGQLVGEGACNIAAALVGGFASSGSFTRTAVNFEAGAKTRMSAIFSGVLVLVVIFALAPLANYIPIAALGGMLVHIGLRLVNVGKMKLIMGATIADRRAVIFTALAVLVVPDLAYALFFGVALSVYQVLRRAEGFKLLVLQDAGSGHLIEVPLEGRELGDVVALDLQGELFFAAAEEIEGKLRSILAGGTRFIVLRLMQAYNMDVTCVEALVAASKDARSRGGRLLLCGIRPGMYGTLSRAGALDELGEDGVYQHEPTVLGSTHRAIDYAHKLGESSAGPNLP